MDLVCKNRALLIPKTNILMNIQLLESKTVRERQKKRQHNVVFGFNPPGFSLQFYLYKDGFIHTGMVRESKPNT